MSENESPESKPREDIEEYTEFPFPTFYSNAIRVTSSYFDFQFLIMDRMSPELVSIRSRVVMAPSHAKLLAGTLLKQIELYEDKFGEIPIPAILAKGSSSSEPEPQT